MAFKDRDFRDALGRFATGVAIITARAERAAIVGMTVNSFTSLSLRPPLILWCLGKDSENFDLFRDAPIFGVNILSREDEALAARCAVPGQHELDETRLASFPFENEGETHHAPFLKDSVASFACVRASSLEAGDHLILTGRVHGFEARGGEPLLYHRGAYARLAEGAG